jgi:hypothetical protein
MARDTSYTLFVNGEPKRLNDDLQRLQGAALDYMKEGNVLTIRCPQPSADARQVILTYDRERTTWARTA